MYAHDYYTLKEHTKRSMNYFIFELFFTLYTERTQEREHKLFHFGAILHTIHLRPCLLTHQGDTVEGGRQRRLLKAAQFLYVRLVWRVDGSRQRLDGGQLEMT